ncbi:ribonuclease H2 subunit C-like isoform X1 [Hydra vulgaris]|uniref:Ribonuclease H2 subunit C-like isoform X1 n=1 Tax=Hydra vulgaris TaxID=6087 RepID=A0ABM4CD82_HYDVU
MSISLEANGSMRQELIIHSVPCLISHNSYAKVDSFFITSHNDETELLKSSFRGRPLQGKEIHIPKGYKGSVLVEKNGIISDHQKRQITLGGYFDKFNYWNLETLPKQNVILDGFDWLGVAEMLHAPIIKEKVEKFDVENST